jgi:hypothetical protein
MAASRAIYTAPWADKLPSGARLEYGPSPTTHARRAAAHNLWSWRPKKGRDPLTPTPADRAQMIAFMRPDGRHLRIDVPRRELEVYLCLYEHARSARMAAAQLGITRSTVRVYLKRLRARMEG